MRSVLITIVFLFGLRCVHAQNSKYDSLKNLLASAKDDSTKLSLLNQLFGEYVWSYPDSSITYLQQSFVIARRMQSDHAISNAFQFYSIFDVMIGDYPQALYNAQESLKFAEKSKSFLAIALAYDQLGGVYEDEGDYDRELLYSKLAKSTIDAHWMPSFKPQNNITDIMTDTAVIYVIVMNGLATNYEKLNKFDSAIKYTQIVIDGFLAVTGSKWAAAAYEFGNIYSKMANYPLALQYYRNGIALALNVDNKKDLMDNYNGIANTFRKTGNYDSSIFYANKVLEVSRATRYSLAQLKALDLLADIFKSENKIDSVAKYLQLTIAAKDSLFSHQKILQIQNMTFNEQLRQQELANEKKELLYKQEREKEALIKKILIASILVLLLLAFIIVRNMALKRRNAENELQIQKLESEKARAELERQTTELQIKAMVATQEEERKRISRDLHDDVGTKLSALNLFLSSLDEKAKCANNNEIRSLAQSSKQFIKEAMYDVRQLLLNLSPTVLEEFGYTTAVEGLVNKINETKQIHFDLVVFGIKYRLKKDYELALYRITQELINNVLKHAEAKHVSLQIGQRDEKLILMMEDDGKGFDVNAHKDGYGLNNLDARTKLMQGTMTIDSQPGKGTSVLVEVPYNFNGV